MHEERVIADRYRLVAPLGRGGHADVYEAVHLESGMAVAVKLLRPARHDAPSIVERFEREARAVVRLRHPNTVRALDSGLLADGSRYLVLELVDGVPLARLVAERGPLSVARVVHIARQLLGSAGEAHAEGLVHRDLKPDNVLVTDHMGAPDHVTVVDFGVAHELDAASLTSGSALVGTPSWMAPEQWLSGEVDARTDLYAIGALIHFMLTGAAPFTTPDGPPAAMSMALMDAHLHTPPPRLDLAACPALADLVVRLLAKRPADRPSDVPMALAALERCAPARVVPAPPRPWRWLAAGLVVALLAFGLGRLASPEAPRPDPIAVAPTVSEPDVALVSAPLEVVVAAAAPELPELAPPTELLVTSEPAGARVTIVETGAVLVATTPERTTIEPTLAERIARGEVTLEFKRPGFARARRPLDALALAAGTLDVRLEPITPTRPERELPPLRTP